MGICLEFLIPHVVMLQPFSKIDYIYFVQLKILHTIPDNHKIKRDSCGFIKNENKNITCA